MELTDQVMQSACWVDIVQDIEKMILTVRAIAEMQQFTWADTMLSSVNCNKCLRARRQHFIQAWRSWELKLAQLFIADCCCGCSSTRAHCSHTRVAMTMW